MDKLEEIPVLPLPEPSWNYRDSISALCFSQQGTSNMEKNIPCQDRSGFRVLKSRPIFIAAVADGIEACALADYGADVAVNSVLDFLETNLEEQASKTGFRMKEKMMAPLLEEAMQHAYNSVKTAADKMGQLVSSMQSTLTFAVYDGSSLYFAHAGDGGIVALYKNREYELVTARHKKEKNAYPLQNTDIWEWGVSEEVAAFVLVTGGVLNTFVRGESENNRVYFPFLTPVFFASQNNMEDVRRTCQAWYNYMMTQKYRSRVAEDLSFVAIVNQKVTQYIGQPEFDKEEWKRQTKIYKEKGGQTSDIQQEKADSKPLQKKLHTSSIHEEEEDEQEESVQEEVREKKIKKKKQSSSSLIQMIQAFFSKIRNMTQGDDEDWDDDLEEDDEFEEEENKKDIDKKDRKKKNERKPDNDKEDEEEPQV